MANPKRRHSHSRTRMRRAHDFLVNPTMGTCKKCGNPAFPHTVCGHCGFYKDREVIKMEEPEAEAEAATGAGGKK